MTTEEMNSLVNEAKRNRFSTIGQNLSDDDVAHIWNGVSEFVEKYMSNQKGVSIPGLGTFSFSQVKLDIGGGKHLLTQRPIFILSEKFAHTHGISYPKQFTPGTIPVVQLNYTAVSINSPYDREVIESCVREMLQAMNRSVAANKNVEISFSGIGRLQIREGRVKMKFFKPFMNSMDGSGNLTESLQNRPGTVDSVISERAASRLITPNTLLLPKLNRGATNGLMTDRNQMPTIGEEDQWVPDGGGAGDFGEAGDVTLDVTGDFNGDVTLDNDLLFPEHEGGERAESEASARVQVPLAVATGVAMDDLALVPQSSRSDMGSRARHPLSKSSPAPLQMVPELFSDRPPLADIKPQTPPSPLAEGLPMTPPAAFVAEDGTFTPAEPAYDLKLPSPPAQLRPLDKSVRWRSGVRSQCSQSGAKSPCGHYNSGQELCYLCHQRERLNVAVSFSEERARRERDEQRLLQQYNEMKDLEAQLKDESENQARRHENERSAAFNLGVSEATKIKKHSRPTDYFPSYVFQRRPLTPPRYIKQNEMNGELGKQVFDKRCRTEAQRADQKFLERLEQVQLAEDLAAQRSNFMKNKVEQQDMYKRALSAQLRCKPVPLPTAEPDTDQVFGKDDLTQEKLAERRRIAQEILREQQELVAQRKRDAILRRLAAQKNDEEVLQRTHAELLEDRAAKYNRVRKFRRHLEDNWSRATRLKQAREDDERQMCRSPGILLHEQCDRYKRCRCCKRNMYNVGQTNVWCESRYVPGSRIIV